MKVAARLMLVMCFVTYYIYRQVRLQCALSSGRFVVEPKEAAEDTEESIGVVEFDTVAFGGEILMELEGM